MRARLRERLPAKMISIRESGELDVGGLLKGVIFCEGKLNMT